MPKVSIVLPTYNRASMLRDAVQSVLDQTYRDWELIIVDDGSTDNTRDVVAKYQDPRIHYFFQNNMKLPAARNTGILNSCGEYVAFLDSDDLFLPEKLQIQTTVLDHNPQIGLVASGWTDIDAQHRPLRTQRPWLLNRSLALNDWLFGCPVIVDSVLVRRDWLMQVDLFDPEQYYVEDWDIWLRLAYAGCQMVWEPVLVCMCTIHAGNMVRNAEKMSSGVLRMFDKFYSIPCLPESILLQKDQVYAHAHLFGAVRAFGVGAASDGEAHLFKAIQLNPELMQGNPSPVLQSIASTALTDQVNDINQYIFDVSECLPRISENLGWSQRQIHALIQATAAFDYYINGSRKQARLKAARALFEDLSWLHNRGILSILLKP